MEMEMGGYAYNYMRRSALKGRLLRALRSQISSSAPPPIQSLETHFNSFSILPRPGQRWVRLLRSDHPGEGEEEHIQIDATLLDDARHITLSVEVSRKDSKDSAMQFLCSAWPDALHVHRVFAAPRPIPAINPYLGPRFKDLDDEMKKAVHAYLEERGVNDDLAAFLHNYIATKDTTEHIRWLTNIHSYLTK